MKLLSILLIISAVQVTAFFTAGSNVLQSIKLLSRTSYASRSSVLGYVNTRKWMYDAATSSSAQQKKDNIRPLTQNWWPVSLVSALDQTKPNAIELLDKKLVLWYDTSSTE